MAGQRLAIDSIGESYEVFAESLLNRIATLTRIGTKQDFGTDTYCQPRVKTGERIETVTELCLLQTKGGTSPLMYGGLQDGKWKGHEFDWLKRLWAPLYLAHVDSDYEHVDLYSLWPIWWVLWQSGTPFKIVCTWKEVTGTVHDYSEPTKDSDHSGVGCGDGCIWKVNLGTPMLRLTHKDLNNDDFRAKVVDVFRRWITADRQTVARYHLGVPLVSAANSWITNEIPGASIELLMMSPTPGALVDPLARALVLPLLALGASMQHQGNNNAFRLIPILEWFQENGYGTSLTEGLREKLTRSQAEGVSPDKYL